MKLNFSFLRIIHSVFLLSGFFLSSFDSVYAENRIFELQHGRIEVINDGIVECKIYSSGGTPGGVSCSSTVKLGNVSKLGRKSFYTQYGSFERVVVGDKLCYAYSYGGIAGGLSCL